MHNLLDSILSLNILQHGLYGVYRNVFPEKSENSYFNELRYLNTDKNSQANLPSGVG